MVRGVRKETEDMVLHGCGSADARVVSRLRLTDRERVRRVVGNDGRCMLVTVLREVFGGLDIGYSCRRSEGSRRRADCLMLVAVRQDRGGGANNRS